MSKTPRVAAKTTPGVSALALVLATALPVMAAAAAPPPGTETVEGAGAGSEDAGSLVIAPSAGASGEEGPLEIAQQGQSAEPAADADPTELFAFANRAYDQSHFNEAAKLYEELLSRGLGTAPSLHYNLGNTYLRRGERGRAIASYLRARALDPRDQDAAANLQFARSSRSDDLAPPAPSALQRTLFFWHYALSRAELIRALVLANLALFGVLTAWLFRRDSEVLRWAAGACLVVLLALLGSLVPRLLSPERVAVMVAPEVEGLNGTNADSTPRFVLHAGTEVRAVGSRAGWVRVALPSGVQGWVQADQVEVVTVR